MPVDLTSGFHSGFRQGWERGAQARVEDVFNPGAGTHETSKVVKTRSVKTRARRVTSFGDPKYFTPCRVPSKVHGKALKVPEFDVLFDQVRAVRPLARQAFEKDVTGGFRAVKDAADVHRWKVVSNNPRRLVFRINETVAGPFDGTRNRRVSPPDQPKRTR